MAIRETAPSRVAAAGLLALASGLGIGRFVFTPILPVMVAGLGLTPVQAGQIASANFAGYLVGAVALTVAPLPAAWRTGWLIGSLLAGAVCLAAMARLSDVTALAEARFLGGAASAVVLVTGSALVLERLTAAGAGRLGPVHFAGVGAGIAVSAVLVSGMEAAGAGWRALWLGAGVLSAVPVPVIWMWLRRPAADRPMVAVGGRMAPGRSQNGRSQSGPTKPGLWQMTLCHGLFGFGYIFTATFLVAAVRASPAARPVEPLVWLLVGLAAMPSVGVWNRVAGRIGTRRAYAAACVLEAIGVAVVGIWPGATGALASAGLLGMTFMGLTALGFAVVREMVSPAGLGRAFAVITVGFGIGQVAGPLLAGALLSRTPGDGPGAFLVPSLAAAGALLVAAVLAGSGVRARAAPPA